ncbi:MAG TPA: ABC transporter permease [Chthoniobacterales bacterium]|nr:ABC transporter permease [Verrucomicrobiota bacterium]MBV8351092.1 ABC transporter permease [Verrucomicrobiota bacterium]HTD15702.1 ABC transporter permease [Chthoniobacterales bacterium]
MKSHRIEAIILRHTCEARHNLNRIAEMVYWPVQNIVVWGFFTVYLARDNHLRPGAVSFLLGAAILWGMFYAFQRDLATGFLEELWSRNIINLFSTPLSISEYLTGLIIVNLLKALLGMIAAALTAWVCYAYNIFPKSLALIPFMLNLALFALAIGVIIIGLIVRYTTRIQTLAWSFAGLLMPFSCVFYPLNSLPKLLRPFAWVLPTTHAFEGMRQAIQGGGFSTLHFAWAITLNALYFLLAIPIFRMMFESARSRGLLVKLE